MFSKILEYDKCDRTVVQFKYFMAVHIVYGYQMYTNF